MPGIADCWGGKFGYKWRNISEETFGGCYLSGVIDF